MHTFQINVLIQFLLSSTCFEHHVFHRQEYLIVLASFIWNGFLAGFTKQNKKTVQNI
jgi:hypothetical protein